VRFTLSLSLVGLALVMTITLAGAANARIGMRPDQPARVAVMRTLVDHYRSVTWTYERAAHVQRTPSSLVDRHTTDQRYLQWSIATWTRRAYRAQRQAVATLRARFVVKLPHAPSLHAGLLKRVTYTRRLTLSLRKIYPGHVTPQFARAAAATARGTLRLWQRRGAAAALLVSEHTPAVPARLYDSFMCIHRFEGAWDSNTGNGYYGGLQLDLTFQTRSGSEFLGRWGTADNWPVWAQLQAAARAYQAGRGFDPWPNTARFCGLV
jgi:hypothetical protein